MFQNKYCTIYGIDFAPNKSKKEMFKTGTIFKTRKRDQIIKY